MQLLAVMFCLTCCRRTGRTGVIPSQIQSRSNWYPSWWLWGICTSVLKHLSLMSMLNLERLLPYMVLQAWLDTSIAVQHHLQEWSELTESQHFRLLSVSEVFLMVVEPWASGCSQCFICSILSREYLKSHNGLKMSMRCFQPNKIITVQFWASSFSPGGTTPSTETTLTHARQCNFAWWLSNSIWPWSALPMVSFPWIWWASWWCLYLQAFTPSLTQYKLRVSMLSNQMAQWSLSWVLAHIT